MEKCVHTLSDYAALLEGGSLLAQPIPRGLDRDAAVALVSYDSREVVPGTLFLCKGAHFKAEFLEAARRKGALAYVSQTPFPQVALPCIHVTDMRRAIAPLADLFYDHPSGKLKVIGLTGTKGKTTAAYYLKAILDEYLAQEGKPECGLLSSIETYDGIERFESHITTPEPLELQRHFAHAVQSGMEYLVMEVSSQALKYHRSLCTDFAATCFINIGVDHISPIEHPDFEDYFSSKLKLFRQGMVNCVNLDCDHAGRVRNAAQAAGRPLITYSRMQPGADVFASQIRKQGGDILFRVRTRSFEREFRLSMPGLFNVENALAAIALCQALDIPQRHIYAGLAKVRVPGRMEVYSSADDRIVAIVDFAHNRMSFESLFRSARAEYPGRRIVAIFGSVGDKALDRRRDLGETAGKYADLSIITEDDSGEEDTLSICREIASYAASQKGAYEINLNRGEAIRRAILDCTVPTVLLVAGKGTETYQKRGQEYVQTPTDGEYVRSFLQEYDTLHRLDSLEKTRTLLSLLPVLAQHSGKAVTVCGPAPREDLDALRAVGVRVAHCPDFLPGDADLRVERLIFLADMEGRRTLERMDARRAEELMEAGQFLPGILPLVRLCSRGLALGAEEAAVLDCRSEHALLLYMLNLPVPGIAVTK